MFLALTWMTFYYSSAYFIFFELLYRFSFSFPLSPHCRHLRSWLVCFCFCNFRLKLMFQAMENKILLSVIMGWAAGDTILMTEPMSETLFLIELTISWRTLLMNVFRMGRFTLMWKLPLKNTPINRTNKGFMNPLCCNEPY